MRKLLHWLESHPITLISLAIALFGMGCIGLADWLAERRWQSYCETARERGVKLTVAELIPPEIPESENWAALPMFRAIFSSGAGDPIMNLIAGPGGPPGFGSFTRGERMDWKAWQTYFQKAGFIGQTSTKPVEDVLAGLEHFAPQIAEWRQWRTRPRCRFPLDYKAGAAMPIPHVTVLLHGASLFALRMRAHLAFGDSEAAYADFEEGMQGYRAIQEEPILISGLVRISILTVLVSAIGDGLCDHHWPDSHLLKLQADLASIRLSDDYRRAFSSERGFVNGFFDQFAQAWPWDRAKIMAGLSAQTGGVANVFALIPQSVFRDNQLRENQYFDELLGKIRPDGPVFEPRTPTPAGPENLEGEIESYYFFLFKLSAPAFTHVAERYFKLETKLRQARLACALERFWISRGAFPESLAELVPAFIKELPDDIYSGLPMIYRRKGAQSFVLYSVGPNGVDDHAVIDPKKPESRQLDEIWPSAPP